VKLQRVELSNEFAAGHSGIRAYILNEIAVHCLRNGGLVQWDFRSGQMYENRTWLSNPSERIRIIPQGFI